MARHEFRTMPSSLFTRSTAKVMLVAFLAQKSIDVLHDQSGITSPTSFFDFAPSQSTIFAHAWVPYQEDYNDDGDDESTSTDRNGSPPSYSGAVPMSAAGANADADQREDGPLRYESVYEYRARNHIEYGYSAQHISDELCKSVDELDCAVMDARFFSNALHTRSIARGNNGKIKVLCVMVRWEDELKTLPPKADYEELWSGDGFSAQGSGPIPSGSIKRYINLNSYGNILPEVVITDWITTNGTDDYYGSLPAIHFSKPDQRGAWHYVLEQLDDSGFDFSPFDTDNDGFLDSVMFLHSGYSGEYGLGYCSDEIPAGEALPTGTRDRVSSHATPGASHKIWKSKDGKYSMGNYAVTSGFRGRCTGNLARLNIITHEFLHTFGLPDMNGFCGIWGGLGAFDIMAKSNGVLGKPAWPPMMSPWTKYELGWSNPIEITEDGTYTARPSAYHDDNFIIKKGYKSKEYLLIENRMPVEWDKDLWDHGMMIYHVDENRRKDGGLIGWGATDSGYPNLRDAQWPGSGQHFKVAVLAPDGRYDLEKCNGHGDAGDFFSSSDQVLGPGNGEYEATEAGTYPNTDSYAFGDIQVTGIVISNFRQVPGSDDFQFDITGLSDPTEVPTLTPTSQPTSAPTARPTANPTDQPTSSPSHSPTRKPTSAPTSAPTSTPTAWPTARPTSEPTAGPTASPVTSPPTGSPTQKPSRMPTAIPTEAPTAIPTEAPASTPTLTPTHLPTQMLSTNPTSMTSMPSTPQPTGVTISPTSSPTQKPTVVMDDVMSSMPTNATLPDQEASSMPSSSPSEGSTSTVDSRDTSSDGNGGVQQPGGDSEAPSISVQATPTEQPTSQPTASSSAVASRVTMHSVLAIVFATLGALV